MAAKIPIAKTLKRIRAAAAHLPGIEDRLSDTAAILDQAGEVRVMGKLVCWFKKGLGGALVARCTLEEKELLIEMAPEIYFETAHYKGWPAVLIHLDEISGKELKHRIEIAWRLQAPRRLIAELENGTAATPKPRARKSAAKKARGRGRAAPSRQS